MASAENRENQELYERFRMHIQRDMHRIQLTYHTSMWRRRLQLVLLAMMQRLEGDEMPPKGDGWQTVKEAEPRRKRAFRFIRSAIRLLILLFVDFD